MKKPEISYICFKYKRVFEVWFKETEGEKTFFSFYSDLNSAKQCAKNLLVKYPCAVTTVTAIQRDVHEFRRKIGG